MSLPGHNQTVAPDASALRVGMLVWRFPVLSETFIATLSRGLVDQGCSVTMLALHPSRPEDGGVDNGLSVLRPDFSARTLPAVAAMARDGLRTWRLAPLALAGNGELRAAVQQARMLHAARRFDIVHCQFATLGLAALRHQALGALEARRLVVHLRGSDITRFVAERGAHVYDGLFRRADLFIANCEHFRDRAIALGCPAEKVIVIGSPVDTDRFRPPLPGVRKAHDAESTPPGPLRLVAVGRLVEKKGFDDAIVALSRLDGAVMSAVLTIVGDGPLRSVLEARAAALGLSGRVRFTGALSQDGVIAALHAADIALAPSVTAADGDQDAPVNTLKEAMATGLPVVATRHGGIVELVRDGENGFLVPERDPDALAAAILRIAALPDLGAALGRRGRADVVESFDTRAVVSCTYAAYARLLEKEPA